MIKLNKLQFHSYPLICMFAAIDICFLLGYLFLPKTHFSQMENRMLAERPQLKWSSVVDASYMNEFETYIEEQLPLRDVFIKCKAICEKALLKCENNNIALGQDGFLFEKSLSIKPQFYKNLSAISSFADGVSSDVYIAIAPTSTYLYEDKVPVGMPRLDEQYMLDQLKESVSGSINVHVIDLNSALLSYDDGDLYYRTDHHWTTLGAYRAFLEIGKYLNYVPVDYDEYKILEEDGFYGTYYAKYKGLGIIPDVIEWPSVPIQFYDDGISIHDSLYDTQKLSEYDKYSMFMYGNPGKGVVRGVNNNGKSLVVLKDSYANCMIPYLACVYENIIVIDPRYFGESIQEVIAANSDADILLLYDWSFVNDDNHFYKIVK